MGFRLLWQSKPVNTKTGPIPTAYVGHSWDESYASCDGCPLRDAGCYAHGGTPKRGMMSMVKAAAGEPKATAAGTAAVAPGGRYSLDAALDSAKRRGVRAARIGALGDPARVDRDILWNAIRRLRRAGLAVIAYTHFWREHRVRGLRRHAMASGDNLAHADAALERGWIPAAIVPADTQGATVETPKGARLLVCPAQRTNGVTCERCRLCDPQHRYWKRQSAVNGIAFLEH